VVKPTTPAAPGLRGKTGQFTALAWTEAEKKENITRRGFIRATRNGHAFEHAGGPPHLLLGDCGSRGSRSDR
jgi:hypothetical protein